jgi:hypothetical protein
MIVTNKIKMDLTNRSLTPTVDVMQDDQMSRSLEISLYSGLEAFELPENCVALVRYKKANGNSGMYDAMPDGMPAWSISKNVVTIALAPQVCSAAGTVSLTVVLFSDGHQLSSFDIRLYVHGTGVGNFETSQYINISNFLPQAKNAQEGHFLKVESVDENGNVTGVSTAKMAGGGIGLIVNAVQMDGQYQMDCTNEQIVSVFNGGQVVYCRFEGLFLLPLILCMEEACVFAGFGFSDDNLAILMVVNMCDGDTNTCIGGVFPVGISLT